MTIPIPPDRLERNPLLTPEAWATLRAVLEHADAPRWNYVVGDRIGSDDLPAVEAFRTEVAGAAPPSRTPPDWLLERVRGLCQRSPFLAKRLPTPPTATTWADVPPMTREDVAVRVTDLVPDDADLSRLIVYDTSGTTGHAIRVPHHPVAVARAHVLLEAVLARHGVALTPTPGRVVCLNVGAQATTVVFATAFAVWQNAAFAKVNLHPRAWDRERARRFFAWADPPLLTGDPMGFAELLAWDLDVHPRALVSTATALSEGLRRRLEDRFHCPVIDTYSLTETGMVAATDPSGPGWRLLAPDLYVEIADPEGRPLPPGHRGQILVSGGRNPYLPLVRYATGDHARLVPGPEGIPVLQDLEARLPVAFRAADGAPVCPVDIGRLLRRQPVVLHRFVQRADGSCHVAVRAAPGTRLDLDGLRASLADLFGAAPGRPGRVDVVEDPDLGADGKVLPFTLEGAPPGT